MIVVNSSYVNKVVVGLGQRDGPKYAGEGVAPHSLLGGSGRSKGSKSMQFHIVFCKFL